MQNNPLQQIAQRHIAVLRQRLQHLQQTLLNPHPRLHPLDDELLRILIHMYQCTLVFIDETTAIFKIWTCQGSSGFGCP